MKKLWMMIGVMLMLAACGGGGGRRWVAGGGGGNTDAICDGRRGRSRSRSR